MNINELKKLDVSIKEAKEARTRDVNRRFTAPGMCIQIRISPEEAAEFASQMTYQTVMSAWYCVLSMISGAEALVETLTNQANDEINNQVEKLVKAKEVAVAAVEATTYKLELYVEDLIETYLRAPARNAYIKLYNWSVPVYNFLFVID